MSDPHVEFNGTRLTFDQIITLRAALDHLEHAVKDGKDLFKDLPEEKKENARQQKDCKVLIKLLNMEQWK